MNAILEQINSAGLWFVEFALPMLVQSGVLILILLLADFALRKKVRAVFRYWIWLLVLIKLVLPTSLSAPLSLGYFFGNQLAYVDRTETTTETAQTAPAIVTPMINPPRIEAGSDTSAIAPTTPGAEPAIAEPVSSPAVSITPITWQGVVFLAWLTVVLTMGLLLLQRAIFVRGLVAQSKEANSMMADTLESCRGSMGVKRKIGLKVSANASSPAVCGLFRPVILVLQNLMSSLSPSQLRAVLLHELAHIKRGDLWVNLAQTVLQIIYFYNPLLWVANCIIRRVREQAVDEMVLVTMGEKARQYPQTLVNVAKLAFKRPALSLRLIGVVESKSALTGRIKHILNRPMPKKAKLGILGLAVVIITAAILLPMASCTPGPPSLVIKGVVKEAQTGKPIAGARVFDDGYGPKPNWEQIKANERSEWGAITNSAGEYSFLTWPEHHSIKVEAPGYKAKRQSLYDGHFVFNKKDEEIFDFALEPEKASDSSEFKTKLPNGVTVELIGVCEHPSEGKQWWRPDGSILEPDHAPSDYSRMTVKPDETEQARELALRFAGQDIEQMSFRWKMDMATRSSSHPFYVTEKREKLKPLRNIVFKLPQNLETLDFSIGIATGEWKRVASGGDGRTVSGTNDSLTDSSVIFHKTVKEKDTLRLCVTHLLGGDYDCRIVVVDRDDEIHEPMRSSNSGSDMRLCKGFFDLSPDQIEYILLQARQYECVEFKNVSLRPGHKTDVQVDVGDSESNTDIRKEGPTAPGEVFSIYGTVTDEQGNPVSGVKVSASCGIDTLFRTGETVTDKNGHYKLYFGPGMRFRIKDTDKWGAGFQAATIYAQKSGLYEANLCRHGHLAMSGRADYADYYKNQVRYYKGVVLPDKPYRLDFVMLPAATIRGKLVDTKGNPVSGKEIWLTGDELYPSSNVLRTIQTDKDGMFTVDSVPCKSIWFTCRYKRDEVRTRQINFSQPGEYVVRLLYDEPEPIFGKPTLTCILVKLSRAGQKTDVQVED